MDQLNHTVRSHAEDIAASQPIPTPAPAPSPYADICAPTIVPYLNSAEQAFVSSPENKRLYSTFRFDRPTGHDGGGPFNDAVELLQQVGGALPSLWPRTIEIQMIQWSTQRIVRRIEVDYVDSQVRFGHGSEGTVAESLTISLAQGERINRLKLGKGEDIWAVEGVAYVEVFTTAGQNLRIGDPTGKEVIDYYPYDGCVGLKGFWGGQGDVIDKLAPIWGM